VAGGDDTTRPCRQGILHLFQNLISVAKPFYLQSECMYIFMSTYICIESKNMLVSANVKKRASNSKKVGPKEG
jgi:hypothetical protein